MHKKPLFAVLALGIMFLASTVAFAALPDGDNDRLPKIASGGFSIGTAPTVAPSKLAMPSDPPVHIQAGTARTVPGTYCSGDWMDSPYFIWNFGSGNNWAAGDIYLMYQDPANTYPYAFGACTSPGYTFDVTAVTVFTYLIGTGPNTYVLRPALYSVDMTDPACPIPGTLIANGPAYNVAVATQGAKLISLPFSLETCVTGPYFAAIQVLSVTANGSDDLRWVTDQGNDTYFGDPPNGLAGIESRSFLYRAAWGGLLDFVDPTFAPPPGPTPELCLNVPSAASLGIYNHQLWSEGYTPDDPVTRCQPGLCGYQWWYKGDPADCVSGTPGTRQNDCWFANHPIPDYLETDVNGERPELWVRFVANGLDTLEAIEVLIGAFAQDATMSMRVSVYDVDPVNTSPDCGKPIPGALRGYVDMPGPFSLAAPTYVDLSAIPVVDRVFGTLNGLGGAKSFFVGLSLTPGVSGYPDNILAPAFGDVLQDYVNPICVSDPHSGAFFPTYLPDGGIPEHRYLGEFMIRRAATLRYRHGEIWMDAYICAEQLPAIEEACTTPGADTWRHYAHDAQLTSSSNINIGDPNGAILRWSQSLPLQANFGNPTVAGDIVYQSSDQAVSAFNLITGAPVGSFSGGVEMGSSNRGNTTVAYVSALGRDVVFATGGTLNAITALETNLETSPIIWSFNPGTQPGTIGLSQQVRFNCAAVLNIGGTDVVFVATEPSGGTARLWALDAATGALYSPGGGNWPTNPIILDEAAKHGPATDGTNLYIGTGLITNVGPGTLYSINATTGLVNWTFVEPNGDGWPSGVSVEGNYLYGASRTATAAGHRYKIDKTTGLPVWSGAQGSTTYGTPTIGRKFVYFPLDNSSEGILQVDKGLGVATRNFATSDDICGITVAGVPNIVSLSCDGYLFAGDRNAHWWCLNAVSGQAEWFREFPIPNTSIVNGTALATGSNTRNYAVVSVREINIGQGQLLAYELDAGSRTRMIQCVEDVEIAVPFGTLGGNSHSEADAILNVGNLPLNISSYTLADPAPDGLAAIRRDERHMAAARSQMAARYMDDYGSYRAEGAKYLTTVGLNSPSTDGEFTAWQLNSIDRVRTALSQTRRASRMAAGASTFRTGSVTFGGVPAPVVVLPGDGVSIDWLWDGSSLERGRDANVITFVHDDPDYNFDFGPTADLNILYIGGCANANTFLTWNAGGSFAKVFNHGAFGDQAAGAYENLADPYFDQDQLFDGGILITGDSSAAIGGAEVAIDYYFFEEYVANPNPGGNCDFEKDSNLVLGYKRDFSVACPGTPITVTGAYVKTYYADTNLNVAGNLPLAAIGVDVAQTEVGANDPLYGDFKLTRLIVSNRDALAKDVRAGSYYDWDIRGAATSNAAIASASFNGYAIWDPDDPAWAYGVLDAHQPSTYGGVDPTAFPPALNMSNLNDTTYLTEAANWVGNTYPGDWGYGWWLAAGKYLGPVGCMGGCGAAGVADDRGGFLLNELALGPAGPGGSGEVVQALFAFDVGVANNNDAFVEAGGLSAAKRAARWAGFARGDVNDDGFVDLADVVWLQCGAQIYPDTYCGDVDNSGAVDGADITRLLSYVSGNAASQPAGAWRFPW